MIQIYNGKNYKRATKFYVNEHFLLPYFLTYICELEITLN